MPTFRPPREPTGATADPMPAIATDKVCHLIVKAREFDVQDVETDPDSASNAADDRAVFVLEEHADDPTEAELRAFIAALDDDEKAEVVALLWLGRGDGDVSEWQDLLQQARDRANDRTADYLLGQPLLGDHLQDGLSAFGLSCTDFEAEHL